MVGKGKRTVMGREKDDGDGDMEDIRNGNAKLSGKRT